MSTESVMPSNHLILCHPLLPLPSIFPSVRVFSSESALASDGQSSGASASALVLPIDIQGWFPLGLTGKGLGLNNHESWLTPVSTETGRKQERIDGNVSKLRMVLCVCVCVCVRVRSHVSHVWLFVTPWTVDHQASLCMGFSQQEYWSGLPCPSPGDLPDSQIKSWSPALQVDSLPLSYQWSPS